MKTDVSKDYMENWEKFEKKLLVIATEEKDNLNVQKMLSAGSDSSEGIYLYRYTH